MISPGAVETQTIGRAWVHTINAAHAAMPPLRALLDPIAVLHQVVSAVADADMTEVVLFGSIARGNATTDSDFDLAVIARRGWDKRTQLEDSVRTRLGNDCDVLARPKALRRKGQHPDR